MDHESMRALIGAVLLWAMGIAAVLYLIRHNWEQIREICDDAMKYRTASICIPPCYVRGAAEYMKAEEESGRGKAVPVCTVIGFPNGNHTTTAKVFETRDAVADGADEIDMVINIGRLREGNDAYVLNEIRQVRAACPGRILKVIIETCLLTEEEKIRMCRIVSASGADFIKTSTGFSTGGATREDVALFKRYVDPSVKVKAAGGIASLQDAERFIALGASRLGTSRIVKLVKASEQP